MEIFKRTILVHIAESMGELESMIWCVEYAYDLKSTQRVGLNFCCIESCLPRNFFSSSMNHLIDRDKLSSDPQNTSSDSEGFAGCNQR